MTYQEIVFDTQRHFIGSPSKYIHFLVWLPLMIVIDHIYEQVTLTTAVRSKGEVIPHVTVLCGV